MNYLTQTNETLRIAIGTITFNMRTSLYRKEDGKLSRIEPSIEHIEIGDTLPFVKIENDIVELLDGKFVLDISRQRPTINYGKLETVNEVNVCSPNGLILRKARGGKSFNIQKISQSTKGVKYYHIGPTEVIAGTEAVRVIVGHFSLKKAYPLANGGRAIVLIANKQYPYSEVAGEMVFLTDEKVWIDLSGLNCELIY